MKPISSADREKERLRVLKKYHANKDRYNGRDVEAGFKYFWASRRGLKRATGKGVFY